MDSMLKHYGVLGMHWGVRRNRPTVTSGRKKSSNDDESEERKDVKSMSDDEIRTRIKRLELENQYKKLTEMDAKQTSKGRAFVGRVLEKSGENIAVQFATYAMGTGVNKLFGEEIVNPKKGQKDKK